MIFMNRIGHKLFSYLKLALRIFLIPWLFEKCPEISRVILFMKHTYFEASTP